MTLDEFATMADLRVARMFFPAKTDEESLQKLRECAAKLLESGDSHSVDEQQNSAYMDWERDFFAAAMVLRSAAICDAGEKYAELLDISDRIPRR